MDNTHSLRSQILQTIVRKTTLKQRVFDRTFAAFNLLKETLLPEVEIVQMKYGNQLQYNTVYNYDEESKEYYLDSAALQLGSNIIMPDSQEKYTISRRASRSGVSKSVPPLIKVSAARILSAPIHSPGRNKSV